MLPKLDRPVSIERIRSVGGTVLCALHPLASDAEIEQVYSLMRNVSGSKLLIFRLRVPRGLPPADFILSESVLEPADYQEIDNFAFSAAERWHLPIPTSHAVWGALGGISETQLGSMVEYRLAEVLLVPAKFVAAVRRAAQQEGPSLVVLPGQWSERLSDTLSRTLGTAAAVLPDEQPSSPACLYDLAEIAALHVQLNQHVGRIISIKDGSGRAILHDGSLFRNEFQNNVQDRRIRVSRPIGMVRMMRFLGRAIDRQPGALLERAMRRRWDEIHEQGILANAFVFQGANLYAAVRPYIEDLYVNIYPRLVTELQIRKTLMELTGVTCVLTDADYLLAEKLDILAARQLGIPSLTVRHGVNGESNGGRTIFADHAAVWGRACLDSYARYGTDPACVQVTGNPRYDALIRSLASRRIADRDKIVFAAQPAPMRSAWNTIDEERLYAETIIGVFRTFPERSFVVKLDPRQSDEMLTYWRGLAAGMTNVEVVRDVDATELLARTSLLITGSSDLGFEAVILGVPIITVNLTRRDDVQPYGAEGVAVGVRDAEGLVRVLAEMLGDNKIAEVMRMLHADFAERFLYRLDGRSSERLLDLCMNPPS